MTTTRSRGTFQCQIANANKTCPSAYVLKGGVTESCIVRCDGQDASLITISRGAQNIKGKGLMTTYWIEHLQMSDYAMSRSQALRMLESS